MLEQSRSLVRTNPHILPPHPQVRPPRGGELRRMRLPVNYNLTWNEVVRSAGPHTNSLEPIRYLDNLDPRETTQTNSVSYVVFYLVNFGRFMGTGRVLDWASAHSLVPVTTRECLGLARGEKRLDMLLHPLTMLATLHPCRTFCRCPQVASVHWSCRTSGEPFIEAKLVPLSGGWGDSHWLAFKEH